MPALTPGPDNPDAPARCPIRLVGQEGGPRCRALILVRDAREHEAWHEALDYALQAPVTVHGGVEAVPWPEDDDEQDATAGPGGL